MNAKRQTAKLLRTDVDYLRHHSLLSDSILNELASKMQPASSLEIDRKIAESIREVATERLAKVGFDLSYEPTEEGRFLETLIDRLFIL